MVVIRAKHGWGVRTPLWLSSAACLAWLWQPHVAMAQDNVAVSEVVVTAQRRTERLQDVPVSVTAIGAAQLRDQRINSADDLVSGVPNLQRASTVGEGTPIFALRGVSMSDYSLNQEGPVATYYDGVYKGTFALLGLGIFDLERVEVLRGPQGTLYGKNTTGGAINLISKEPSAEAGGYLQAGIGNYNRRELDGAVQGALNDDVSGRLAFTYAKADGWSKNLLPGEPNLNGIRQYGLRGTLKFEPSDALKIVLRGTYTRQDPYNYAVYGLPTNLGVGGELYATFGVPGYFRTGLADDEVETSFVRRRKALTRAVAMTVDWQVADGLTLSSISSYDKGTLVIPEDSDGSPLNVTASIYDASAEQVSQDVRLTSDLDRPFNFILGAYANRSKIRNTTESQYGLDLDLTGDGRTTAADCSAGLSLGIPVPCVLVASFEQIKTSLALYSDLKYQLSERVTLRGGLRFTHDEGDLNDYTSQARGADGVPVVNLIPGDPTNLNATTALTYRNNNLSGKIGLDYRFENGVLAYASLSRGYRGAAFNAQAFNSPAELGAAEPEVLDSAEAGFKSQWFDRSLTLNASAFFYRYKNMQFVDFDGVMTFRLVNLPLAYVYGGELELQARPIDSLTLSAGLGLMDSEVRRGSLRGVDLMGNQLFNAPHVTFGTDASWRALSGEWGTLTANLGLSYVSDQYFEIFNSPDARQKGYGLIDATLRFDTPSGWSASLWAKNLTDKFYTTARLQAVESVGSQYTQRGTPRTYGLTVRHDF